MSFVFSTQWVNDYNTSGNVWWHTDFHEVLIEAGMQVHDFRPADEPTLFAYDSDDQLVGVAQVELVRDGFNERFGAFEALPAPQAMLDKVAVLPKMERLGVGRMLVREVALKMFRHGCTHVAVMVDQSTDTRARVAFFESCGFTSLIPGVPDDLLGAEITTVLERTAQAERRRGR